ncbi:MAG: site-specific integrase [Betaproteobacteria bacterium]|nr:site-specific integrase [Betaproteobacteria bacterium]
MKLTDDKIALSAVIPEGVEGVERPAGDAQIQPLPSAVGTYLSAAIADNTRRAYRGDLADFLSWGGAVPCSPEILAAYIADRAEVHSPHTISRRVVGVSRAHVSQGLPDPAKTDLVRTMLRGVRRSKGKPQRRAAPLLKQDLLAILSLMRGTKGIRDRAMSLIGFAAALRRSELVALDVQDLEFVREGLIIHLRRSKTDQEGVGRKIAVPYGRTSACPVKAVRQWLEHGRIESGAVFRSISKGQVIAADRLTGPSVSLILKGYAAKVGLPAAHISGHSLRSGLVTSAAQIGVSTYKIQQQTGHRSAEMLARYIRDANLFENNAASFLL